MRSVPSISTKNKHYTKSPLAKEAVCESLNDVLTGGVINYFLLLFTSDAGDLWKRERTIKAR